MSGLAFDIKADVCQMEYIRPLNPPGDQKRTVCWVREDFGVAPGSDPGGTSYILGHAWAKTPGQGDQRVQHRAPYNIVVDAYLTSSTAG